MLLDRTRKLFLRGAAIAAAASALVVIVLSDTRAHDWLESGTYDARMRLAAERDGDRNIVIIDIDDASFTAMKEKGWRWPWTRRAWAATVRHITPGHPKAVVFDAIFGGEEDESVDTSFAERMREAGNVILAYTFSKTEAKDVDPSAREARWALLDSEKLVTRHEIGERVSPEEYLVDAPMAEFVAASAGLGSIAASVDSDGTIRRVPLEFVRGKTAYRSLSARTAVFLSGIQSHRSALSQGEFQIGSTPIPVDKDGKLLLWWHKNYDPDPSLAEGSFPYQRIPIWQIFCALAPTQCDPEVTKPEALGKTWFPSDYFHDKVVIIGASAAGSYDLHPTPFRAVVPGFLAHATAIDNLLHGEAVRPAPSWVLPLLVVAMSMLGTAILVWIKAGVADFAWAGGALVVYLLVSYAAFAGWRLWLPFVAPVAAFVISYFATGAVRYATTGRELRRTRGTLDRYISPELVNYVLENLEQINLAGDKRELTIFFSDVRNFTTLSEKTDPMELIALLNEYLAAMTEIVFKHDGIVDKFIGDGILAYWGAFTPGKNHALLAAKASLEMLTRLEELNRKFAEEGRQQISIGIGLNTGEVIFGNVGSGKKVEFTVIGDPVNLASRLEGLNKDFGTSIIVSDTTRERLGDAAVVRPLGGVKVKGKTVETAVYELQWMDSAAPQPRVPNKAQPASAN